MQKKWLESINSNLSEESFNQQAIELLSWQVTHCDIYKRYCEISGIDTTNLSQWHEFPALPISAFRHQKVSCKPNFPCEKIFLTSGTSSKQRGKQHLYSTDFYHRALQKSFKEHIPLPPTIPWVSLIPPSEKLPESSLAHMISHLAQIHQPPHTAFCSNQSFEIDFDLCLKNLEANQPIALFSTSFALVQLCDFLHKNQIALKLHQDSILFETGGSKGRVRELSRTEMQTLLKDCLGLQKKQIFYEYGMTELSSQCYASAIDEIFHPPAWMKVLIIDPKTGKQCTPGQTGLLHFYDLANVYTCAAIATQDCGQYIDQSGRFLLYGRAPSAPARGCSLPYEITT